MKKSPSDNQGPTTPATPPSGGSTHHARAWQGLVEAEGWTTDNWDGVEAIRGWRGFGVLGFLSDRPAPCGGHCRGGSVVPYPDWMRYPCPSWAGSTLVRQTLGLLD
jgi:hypothetical protein